MKTMWFPCWVGVVACIVGLAAAEVGQNGVLDLSNGRYQSDVLRKRELTKHGEPAQWEEINLAGNAINEVDDNTFVGFENLKKLSLASNSLGTIEDDWFRGTKLNSLDLSGNYLVAIRSDAFSTLTNLQELNLARNILKPFKQNTFSHTPHIIKLNMENNSRVQDMFLNVTIPSLEELSLKRCRIGNVTSLHLKNLPNLKKIDLRENSIHELGNGLESNAKLKEVDLRDNFLDSIRGSELKAAFGRGSEVVLHFDLHADICTDCKLNSCTDDLDLQSFLCQNQNSPTLQDAFQWNDHEKNIKLTLKAYAKQPE